MLRHSLLVLCSLIFLPACQDSKIVAVKEFRLYADTDDASIQHAIKILARRYNQQFGSTALTVVDTEAESNSQIDFTEGLKDDGQKLGLGQWLTHTDRESSLSMSGERNVETVYYSMHIQFDADNFAAKAPSIDDSTSDEAIHLYHLFAHEVGHGMQMDHSRDYSSVMYPTIPEKAVRYINYNDYFSRARSFMGSH